jgi:hypothetical protein
MRVTIVCLDVPHTVKVRCRTAKTQPAPNQVVVSESQNEGKTSVKEYEQIRRNRYDTVRGSTI